MLKSTSEMKLNTVTDFPELGNPQHVPFLPERFRKTVLGAIRGR